MTASPERLERLRAFYERHFAAAAGVPVVAGPRVTGDGYYEAVVRDPDGNEIEVMAYRSFPGRYACVLQNSRLCRCQPARPDCPGMPCGSESGVVAAR